MRDSPMVAKSTGPSVGTLDGRLTNIEDRMRELRARLEQIYELSPVSKDDSKQAIEAGPSISALNSKAGTIQTILADCEDIASKIRG